MPVPGRLFLKVIVLINAVVLIAGLICYQSGRLSPSQSVTQDDLNAVIDTRRGGPLEFSLNAEFDSTEENTKAHKQDGLQLADGTTIVDNRYSGSNSIDSVIPAVFVNADGTIELQIEYEEMRRRPEPASSELLLHDSLKLMMSSTKSVVIIPRTPEEKEKAVDRYISLAQVCFSNLDLNRDDKLSKRELGFRYWEHFERQGAVSKSSINFDGFLKHFVWYIHQTKRLQPGK